MEKGETTMPSVMDTLEAAEVHIQEYQEATPATPAAPQSRFKAMLSSLRASIGSRQQLETPSSPPFETGADMLSRKYPYAYIRALCG